MEGAWRREGGHMEDVGRARGGRMEPPTTGTAHLGLVSPTPLTIYMYPRGGLEVGPYAYLPKPDDYLIPAK